MAGAGPDSELWEKLSPMQLAVAKIMRAHGVTPVHGRPGEYKCGQCHVTIEAPEGCNHVNVERFHQAQVIIRALAGE